MASSPILKVTVLEIKSGYVVLGFEVAARCPSPSSGGVGTNPRPGTPKTTTRREPPPSVLLAGTLEIRGARRGQSRVRRALRQPRPNLLEGEPDHVTLGNPVSRHRFDSRLARLRTRCGLLLGRGENRFLRFPRSRGAVFPWSLVQKAVLLSVTADRREAALLGGIDVVQGNGSRGGSHACALHHSCRGPDSRRGRRLSASLVAR